MEENISQPQLQPSGNFPSSLPTFNNTNNNQNKKRNIMIVLLIFSIGFTALGFLYENQQKEDLKSYKISHQFSSKNSQTPVVTNQAQEPVAVENEKYSIDPLIGGNLLKACGENLTELPESAVSSLKTSSFVDLSNNKLTNLTINENWQKIKELNLVRNNFSLDQQIYIKKMLPNTKVAFVPQNGFNSLINSDWKRYSNSKYHFTFKYHPDLLVTEKEGEILVNNDLASLESGFASCSVGDFIGIGLTEKDNSQHLTPLEYINKDFRSEDRYGEITLKGNPYMMIGEIKPIIQRAIDGLTFSAGENGSIFVYASHGDYMYVFNIWSGGETGSGIGDLPKEVFYNILSTIKFD